MGQISGSISLLQTAEISPESTKFPRNKLRAYQNVLNPQLPELIHAGQQGPNEDGVNLQLQL